MTRLHLGDNPFSLDQVIDFWQAWSADKARGYDLQFVDHMIGFMTTDWMPSKYRQRPLVDLLLLDECPFRDGKGRRYSKNEIRRRLPRIALNGEPITSDTLLDANLINDEWAVIRVGKRHTGDYWIVRV